MLEALKALELFDGVRINFSLTNNMGYYSGIVFKGYIKGIPTGVLSGGQYDSLMKKLKKDTSAIGFAVYLDSFERLNPRVKENDVDVFIVTDGNTDAVRLLKAVEEIVATGKSVLTGASSEGVRAGRIIDVEGRELV